MSDKQCQLTEQTVREEKEGESEREQEFVGCIDGGGGRNPRKSQSRDD